MGQVDKYAELLEVHDIPLPDDAEAEHAVSDDDDDDQASAGAAAGGAGFGARKGTEECDLVFR